MAYVLMAYIVMTHIVMARFARSLREALKGRWGRIAIRLARWAVLHGISLMVLRRARAAPVAHVCAQP